MKQITQLFNHKLTVIISCLLIVFFVSMPAHAITWTYYDINDKPLQNPTDEEINSMAIMRVSDTGITQYILEIQHDFSGTWGTGYLENIGNPSPGIGKHWINAGEDVVCNVDGIVQDVYNLYSRYISIGYFAQGSPNTKDKANALSFDGTDDYIDTNISITSPETITIEFQAKRSGIDRQETIIAQKNGLMIGFNSSNQAVFNTPHGTLTASKPTYTGWHQWKFVYAFYVHTYQKTQGNGVTLTIYRDGENLGEISIEPPCKKESNPYKTTQTVEYCYKPNVGFSIPWSSCSSIWGYYGAHEYKHPTQICSSYDRSDNCTQCYKRWDKEYSKNECIDFWWGKSSNHYHSNPYKLRSNQFYATDMLHTKTEKVTKYKYSYSCESLTYDGTGGFMIGKDDSGSDFFEGQIKDVSLRVNKKIVGQWLLNDGNQSTTAIDSSIYHRNGTLHNFNTDTCWVTNPKLSKFYGFEHFYERQSIPKFAMNSASKIIFDWGRQHAVIVNTLPENLDNLTTIEVLSDESQSGYTGSGKFWYNHGTSLLFTARQDDCQLLSGYRDNLADPNTTIYIDTVEIDSL